jgi:hypothetical protein
LVLLQVEDVREVLNGDVEDTRQRPQFVERRNGLAFLEAAQLGIVDGLAHGHGMLFHFTERVPVSFAKLPEIEPETRRTRERWRIVPGGAAARVSVTGASRFRSAHAPPCEC